MQPHSGQTGKGDVFLENVVIWHGFGGIVETGNVCHWLATAFSSIGGLCAVASLAVEASFDSKKMSVRVICVSGIPRYVLMLDLLSVGLIVSHQISNANLRLVTGEASGTHSRTQKYSGRISQPQLRSQPTARGHINRRGLATSSIQSISARLAVGCSFASRILRTHRTISVDFSGAARADRCR